MRYVFGDYEVDTRRDELRHKGISCRLESHALQVLVYLVQHSNRVVLEEELLAQLWPQQNTSRLSLRQRLRLARQAVGDSGRRQRVIKTVPGRGYQFVAIVEEQIEALSSPGLPLSPVSTFLPPQAAGRSDASERLMGGPSLQCPRCQHANPAGAKFCNACATLLQLLCPSCGTGNPSGAKFCHQCATPLAGLPPDAHHSQMPLAYTPSYLTEKILASRATLEGERKQVTVMFADMKGSTALIEGLDPEEVRQRLDPVLHLMMEAVHRYEGTVNHLLGDGIMALFGAPVAHEDHALRACYAALAMQAALRRYSDEVRRTQGLTVQIRVGINSGEVVVRAIGNDLSMDYSAIGQTTHLASRMEQLAPPGSILLPAATLHLVQGLVQVHAMGAIAVKGLTDPVEVFELIGAAAVQPWSRVAMAQGFTRFVGRHIEMQALDAALARAGGGRGQIVAVSGDPGIGKSRLLYEFSNGPLTEGWRVLEIGAVSYGRATSYLPIRDLLRAYFQIDDQDNARKIQEKVDKRLTWDEALQETRPVVLALLDVAADAPEWQALEPPQRRQRIIEGVKLLLLQESQVQPLLVLIENLHWIDAGTQAVLDSLIESLPRSRLLLLVSYRPEYQHGWGSKTYYTPLRLHPLPPETAEVLLEGLLGPAVALQPVKHLLLNRSEGNPFFLEESVRALVETQVLAGERGAYCLAKPLASIQVPATVQAILAARIDRLPLEEKQLLQSAAVVGREVAFPLLQAIAEVPEDALRGGLAHLQKAEFLYETRLYPEPAYTFKHALTHDVAYGSLLQGQRRVLHARIVEVMECLWSDRLVTHVEQFAHHALHGARWEKALLYCRQAGSKATMRSAHREAVEYFTQALAALQNLPETPETWGQAIDLHFDVRNALLPLGDHAQVCEHLRMAETLARRLNDQRRLGRTFAYLADYFRVTSEPWRAIESGEHALALATALGDFTLEVMATFFLGASCSAVGEYRRAADYFRRNVASLQGELRRERFGMTGLPAVMSRTWLVACLDDLGEFDEGTLRGDEAIRLAEAAEHPFSLTQALYALGTLFLHKGELHKALPLLERGLDVCQTASILTWFSSVAAALGYAYALSERIPEALPLLQQAVGQDTSRGISAGHARRIAYLSEAYLLTGRLDEAADLVTSALAFARTLKARGFEAYALWLQGEIAAHQNPLARAAAEACYQQALTLATALGMRPLQAHCHCSLGTLYAATGERERARSALSTAIEMYRAMDMTLWLPQTEAALVQG